MLGEMVRSHHVLMEAVFTALRHQGVTAAMLCLCYQKGSDALTLQTVQLGVYWLCIGTGKTTLLRALAAHQIKGIPDNCQILHVEQEVLLARALHLSMHGYFPIASMFVRTLSRSGIVQQLACLPSLQRRQTELSDDNLHYAPT